jgi:hypothetical protein
VTTYCQRPFKLNAVRGTRLDTCGNIVHGLTSTVVSKGLTKVTMTPTYESGTDYLVRNGNDELEVNEQGQPPLRWWEVTIDFIAVDPYWVNIALGWPLVLDDAATPNVVGWRSEEGDTAAFALEGWQNLAQEVCSSGVRPYGYRLLPYLLNSTVTGDVVMENGVTSFSIKAHTHNNSPWGTGPYNIRLNNASTPSPLLTAIQPLQHFHWERVLVAPPTAACGAQNLP